MKTTRSGGDSPAGSRESGEARPPAPAVVARFLSYLHLERGFSPHTVGAYEGDVTRFLAGLPASVRDALADVEEPHVFDYLVSERRRGQNPRSVRRALAAVRTFFRFLVLEGDTAHNPARFLESPKVGRKLPAVLAVDEISRLLDAAADPDSRYPLRDQALLELLYACGLRVSEAVSIAIDDIHEELGVLRCMGKGSKERVVPVTARALAALRRYIDGERPRLVRARRSGATRAAGPAGRRGRAVAEPVFLSRGGRPLGREMVNAILRKAMLRSGVTGKVSAHTLRHSFATHLLHNGADLRIVQELLGHAKVATTEIYTHVEKSELKKLHRKFHPRG